jgi:hypothetical protein
MPRLLVTLSCALAMMTACSKDRPPAAAAASSEPAASAAPPSFPREQSRAPVQIEMKNVRLHADEGIVLEVRHLRGEMVPKAAGQPPVFDDQRSYALRVHGAEVAMDMPSLTNLMNHHVFAFENAPLSDITVEVDEGQLKLKGVYFSGSDIRFGKLTMSGADLQLIDSDPKDPFDFFPAQYKRQLVAGFSKNTPAGGLKTYLPDYSDLGRVKDLGPPNK